MGKKEYNMTVNQILCLLKHTDETKDALEKALVAKAMRQELLETQYDDLATLIWHGIGFLNQVREGDVLTPEWVDESQHIVEQARKQIQKLAGKAELLSLS